MARTIYERDTDALFIAAFDQPEFTARFLKLAGIAPGRTIRKLEPQAPHPVATGSIDIAIELSDGERLLIENKIDANYSVTRAGEAQPERYAASVSTLKAKGITARSVLLAPKCYLEASRHARSFDAAVSYEDLRPVLSGTARELLDAAILQAQTPYEPDPNAASATFFEDFYARARKIAPRLKLKDNPNGAGVRPTGSHTIYVDVPGSLRAWRNVPKPRMLIQAWDSGAHSASVKIMIGGLGHRATELPVPVGLARFDGYLRPAGKSLGCTVDTPRLDTQRPLAEQLPAIDAALQAAAQLQDWWNGSEKEIRALVAGA
ncbi:MAG: hypothetical protein H5U24_16580 [Thioclava marina]|jgi:hypothetical protein|uniref:hypothetical protein n=1 Tax=Thioclava marina TaxID=1915077 RepID=UPI0019C7D225|nr:hypothetical protein [Thioclava marina]MBC7146994.1 hypothetical protein [Thioclava marina]